jgi:Uma2 family endonuclease
MTAAAHRLSPPDPGLVDQRVLLQGVAWADYERLLDLRGERPVPRMTFLDGDLELMTPSLDHEGLKIRLGRLIDAYADRHGVPLEGFGSWTIRSEQRGRGAEADACYVVGPLSSEPKVPDFAIEVVWTRGAIDKLEVYRGLGVPEVWVWQGRRLRFYALGDAGHRTAVRSRFLPELDPRLIETCMDAPSQTEALRLLREGDGS